MVKKICVYKITSPSKKVYIGSTIHFESRMNNYKTLRCKDQIRLYYSLKKYGFDRHKVEILCYCDLDDVRQKEAYYGQLFNCLSQKGGLNCAIPKHGEGFKSISEETRKKLSVASRNMSEETRKKIGIATSNRKVTEETRERLRIAQSNRSEEYRNRVSENNKNRSKGLIRLIADKNIGSKRTEANKKNMSEAKKTPPELERIKEQHCKLLLNTQTGIYYRGYEEAAFSIGSTAAALYHRAHKGTLHKTPFIIA